VTDDDLCGASAVRRSVVALVVVVLAACDGSSSPSSDGIASTAPSGTRDGGFVAPPHCDADELLAWTAAVRIDQRASTADAVLRVAHETGQACELVLGDGGDVAPSVEPNVVLEPGGWAELVVGQRTVADGACATATPVAGSVAGPVAGSVAQPVTSVRLLVGDADLIVPTAAVSRCGAHLTELLAAEHPTEPCTVADVSAVWRPGGFVLRNDGSRGCAIGELEAVVTADGSSLPATSSDVGGAASGGAAPPVDALAGGDVVLFTTSASPDADCAGGAEPPTTTPPMVDAVLVLSAGVEVAVATPASCVSVALGAAQPWFGSPAGPLRDTDPDASPADLLRALDAFGDPCVTVPVAPAGLVDGGAILSPAQITDDALGRIAVWGDPATTGVTQRLDVTIRDGSFVAGAAWRTIDGPTRRAAVVAADDRESGPYVDIAEADGSCVRRYVLAPGTPVDAAAAAARRWVAGPDGAS
jgi:hypothetical protein